MWTLLLVFKLSTQALPGYQSRADCDAAYVAVWNKLNKTYSESKSQEEWTENPDGNVSLKLLPPLDLRPIEYVCVQNPGKGGR